jgi:hypothetical protein
VADSSQHPPQKQHKKRQASQDHKQPANYNPDIRNLLRRRIPRVIPNAGLSGGVVSGRQPEAML